MRVADVMSHQPVVVPDWIVLQEFLDQYALAFVSLFVHLEWSRFELWVVAIRDRPRILLDRDIRRHAMILHLELPMQTVQRRARRGAVVAGCAADARPDRGAGCCGAPMRKAGGMSATQFLVSASTHLPSGKARMMARVIRVGAKHADPELLAAMLALDSRRDKGRPFVGEYVKVTPLIGAMQEHGDPILFVFDPDTHELTRKAI